MHCIAHQLMPNAINSYIDLPSHRNLLSTRFMVRLRVDPRLKHAQLQTKFRGLLLGLCDEKLRTLTKWDVSTDYGAV